MSGMTNAELTLFVSALVAIIIASMYVVRVPKGQVFLVERFGQYHRTLEPGFSVVPVLTNRVAHKLDREQSLHIDFDLDTGKGMLAVTGDCRFRIEDPVKAIYSVADLNASLRELVENRVRNATRRMAAKDVIAAGENLKREALRGVQKAAPALGVAVLALDLDFFDA